MKEVVWDTSGSISVYCNVLLKTRKGTDWIHFPEDARTNEFLELADGRFDELYGKKQKEKRSDIVDEEERKELATKAVQEAA